MLEHFTRCMNTEDSSNPKIQHIPVAGQWEPWIACYTNSGSSRKLDHKVGASYVCLQPNDLCKYNLV
jgi:hypothetical protein